MATLFYDNDADLERYYLEVCDKVEAPLGIYECPVPRSYHLGVPLVRLGGDVASGLYSFTGKSFYPGGTCR